MHLVCDFYVVVCTLYGHSFTFEPGVPVRVPEWMAYEVMAHGPRPVDGSAAPHQETPDGPPPDPDPEDLSGPVEMPIENEAPAEPESAEPEETSKPKKRK